MNPGTGSNVPVALKTRGDELARNGDFDQAIRYYLKAVDLDPSYVPAWNNLGYSYAKSGMAGNADRCREKIRQLKARAADKPKSLSPPHLPHSVRLAGGTPQESETDSSGGTPRLSAEALLARLKLPSRGQQEGSEKSRQVPDGNTIPIETDSNAELGKTFDHPSAGAPQPDQEEPEVHGKKKVPADADSAGGFWERLKRTAIGHLEQEEQIVHEVSEGEPPGIPGAVRSSPDDPGLFSRLKNRESSGSRFSSFRRKKEPVSQDPGAEQDRTQEALHMEGGEVFRFQGGRSVCTIRNCGQLVDGFDRVLESHPELSAGLRGIALYSLGRFREALDDFDKELGQDPGATGIWILRARVLTRLGKNEEALYSCEQALGLDRDNFDAWRQQGFVLQNLGREQEALHALDRALSLNPHSAEVWVARGRILHILSRDHEALQSYDRAVAIDPRSSDLWLSRARSLARLGREEEALSSLEHGIAANPDNPSLFICQGRMFHTLGKPGEALTAYDRALTIRPDDARTWEAMGAVLAELGKFQDEAAAYDRALALDPENPVLYRKRGDALARSGKYAEAARDFRKGLEISPGDINLIQKMGMALAGAGRADEARRILRPILEGSHDGPGTMKAGGEALLLLGDYREALAAFREAVSSDPDDAGAQQGVRKAEAAIRIMNGEDTEMPDRGSGRSDEGS